MIHKLLMIIGGVTLIAALWIIAIVIDVIYSVDNAPKKNMVVCEKHGMIPEETQYTLLEDMELEGSMTRQPVKVCPFCFEEAVVRAKQRYK